MITHSDEWGYPFLPKPLVENLKIAAEKLLPHRCTDTSQTIMKSIKGGKKVRDNMFDENGKLDGYKVYVDSDLDDYCRFVKIMQYNVEA